MLLDRQKKTIIFIIILQVLLILAFLGYSLCVHKHFEGKYSSPEDKYFSVYGSVDAEKGGYYVDSSFGEEGIFTCGPYIDLPKGIYQITIFYEATGTDHTCLAYDEDSYDYANGLESDVVNLDEYHTKKTFDVWLERDLDYFEVRTFFGGDGSLLIKEIVIEDKMTEAVLLVVKLAITLFVLDVIVCFVYLAKKKLWSPNRVITSLILFGIIIFSSAPVLGNGLINADMTDYNYVLMRIEGVKDGILSGIFPVRIQPNWLNGYGYGVSLFYGDLLLVFPALLRIVGFTVQDAWNIFSICINALSCLVAYFCIKGIFRRRSIALVGTMIYMLSTYRLAHLLVSPKGGTTFANLFVPLIVYGMYLIIYEPKNRKSWICIALGMTGLIQSHLQTCLLVAICIAITLLIAIRKFWNKDSVLSMIKAVFASMALNIGFLIPYLYCAGGDFYVFSDLWKIPANYIQKLGGVTSDYLTVFKTVGMKTTVDVVLIFGLAVFVGILLLLPKKTIEQNKQKYWELGFVSSVLSLILLLFSSKYFPWDVIEECVPFLRTYINSIQYPIQRTHGIINVLLIFVVCCDFVILKDNLRDVEYKIGLCVTCGLVFVTSSWLMSDTINNAPRKNVYDLSGLDVNRISTKTFISENANPDLYIEETARAGEGVEVCTFNKDRLEIWMECINNTTQDSAVEVPLAYYQWYTAEDEQGKELEIECSDIHTVQVKIPGEYAGNIHIYFEEPITWTISFWISVVSALLIFGTYIVLVFRERKKNEKSIDYCQP